MIHVFSPFESEAEARGTRNLAILRQLFLMSGERGTLVTTRFSHTRKEFHPPERKWSPSDYHLATLRTIGYKKNVSLRRLASHWFLAFSYLWYGLRKIQRNDVILVSSIPPELCLAASVISAIRSAWLVLDVRDIWPDALPTRNPLARTLFALYCRALYGPSFRRVDRMAYVAPCFEDWISRFRGADSIGKSLVLLGYDQSRWEPETQLAKRGDGRVSLVYIGSLESQFRLESVIDFVGSHDFLTLEVVGAGSKLAEYERRANGNTRVRFWGHVAPGTAVSIVRSADIGVLPITFAAQMPNKLFDYLGAGIGIWVIGESDAARFVREEGIGFSADPADAGEALSSLRNARSFGERCKMLRKAYSKEVLYSGLVTSLADLNRMERAPCTKGANTKGSSSVATAFDDGKN